LQKRKVAIAVSIVLLSFVGATFFIIRMFFVWMVRVPTGAMLNTIVPGDHLVATKVFGRIERSRIVVFQYTGHSEYRVGRVVGLPGETILIRGHIVYINDRPLEEQRVMAGPDKFDGQQLKEISTEGTGPYRVFYTRAPDESDEADAAADFATLTPFHVPDDSYFVLGDNRDNSEDSRFVGPVPRNLIWGAASVIYTSYSKSNDVRWERVLKRIE
jgi:signal peptidase I